MGQIYEFYIQVYLLPLALLCAPDIIDLFASFMCVTLCDGVLES